MTVVEVLSQLRARETQFWLDGDWLPDGAGQGALTPDLRAEIAGRREG